MSHQINSATVEDKSVIIWDVKNEQAELLPCCWLPVVFLLQATVATLTGHESAVQVDRPQVAQKWAKHGTKTVEFEVKSKVTPNFETSIYCKLTE